MRVNLCGRGDFTEWRDAARYLLQQGCAPRDAEWGLDRVEDLFSSPSPFMGRGDRVAVGGASIVTVPPAFIDLAEQLICHSDPARFALAYRLLWRLQTEKALLEIPSDPDVSRARMMVKSVHRDEHKMTAFVRFKEVPSNTPRRAFVAWFEPDHHIVHRTAPFFQRRFGDMDWAIATPKGTASWDGESLCTDDEPAARPDLNDETDELWRTYFANIFNPARLKVKSMQAHMPKKYWKNLPEAGLIPDMISGAESRVREMADRMASDTLPKFHQRLHGKSLS
ncbi:MULTISPECIES: TIGR03915 family putative DNA repair protein [Asticcacaulis]|uniref:TIGR03915 family putative DNA repair protein n=1 Tax=Asticcacaulis TaxID=76890 RepID=UPI001AE704CC|nr:MULTISPECIES: TIGR03915 family putative DNA repair protein [Asticcacaulis]